MADPVGLGAVDAVPRPLGVAVEPHAVVAALAPRALGQRERRARRHRLERLAQRHARQAGARHPRAIVLEPERALEPPVAEQLRVVRRAHEAGAVALRPGQRLSATSSTKWLACRPAFWAATSGSYTALVPRSPWLSVIRQNLEAAREVLLVELEVARTHRGSRAHGSTPGRCSADRGRTPPPDRCLRARQPGRARRATAPRRTAWPPPARPAFLQGDVVSIEEHRLARRRPGGRRRRSTRGRGPPASPRCRAACAGRGHCRGRSGASIRNEADRRIPAARCRAGPPEVAAVRLDRRAELQVDRLVARQERQVAVRRRAGDDLHVAGPLEVGERAGDVAADPPVHLPHALEEFLPEVGQAYDLLLALAGEVLAGFGARAPGVVMVKDSSFWNSGEASCSVSTGERLIVHLGEIPSATRRWAVSRRGR